VCHRVHVQVQVHVQVHVHVCLCAWMCIVTLRQENTDFDLCVSACIADRRG
jgi:hypothetical protein